MKTFSVHLFLLTTYFIGGFRLLASEIYYENPNFKKLNPNTEYTSNYIQKISYGDGNITTYEIEGTIEIPENQPEGFRLSRSKGVFKFSNPTIGSAGEYTKYTDNIDGWGAWNRKLAKNDFLGQDNSNFIYADGTPKTQYLKKGEVWDTYGVSINNIYALGKYWSFFSWHHSRFTVLGLTKSLIKGHEDMLLINKQVASKHQIKDFRETVGNAMRLNAFLSLQLKPIKTYQGHIKVSKNFGVVEEVGEYFGIDENALLTVGDDSSNVTVFSGEKSNDILQQILKLHPKYTVLYYLDSSSPIIPIQGFKELKFDQSQQSIPHLNSWTWNGAFPWVYNSLTDSWFYYAFSGNSYNAYDARSGSWFTFDSGTGAWNPSN